MEHISRLKVILSHDMYPETYTLLDKHGGWLYDNNGTTYHNWLGYDRKGRWEGQYLLTEDQMRMWCGKKSNRVSFMQRLQDTFLIEF